MQERNELHGYVMGGALQCSKPRLRNTPNLGVFKTTEFVGITYSKENSMNFSG